MLSETLNQKIGKVRPLQSQQDEKTKSGAWSFSSGQVRAKSHRAALGEAVLRVAHFDSAPVARPYQADETQQVGESPGHIGGIVSTGKVPSTNLETETDNLSINHSLIFLIKRYYMVGLIIITHKELFYTYS